MFMGDQGQERSQDCSVRSGDTITSSIDVSGINYSSASSSMNRYASSRASNSSSCSKQQSQHRQQKQLDVMCCFAPPLRGGERLPLQVAVNRPALQALGLGLHDALPGVIASQSPTTATIQSAAAVSNPRAQLLYYIVL